MPNTPWTGHPGLCHCERSPTWRDTGIAHTLAERHYSQNGAASAGAASVDTGLVRVNRTIPNHNVMRTEETATKATRIS